MAELVRRLLPAVLAGVYALHPAPAAPQNLPVRDERETYLRTLQLLGQADVGSLSALPLGMWNAEAALSESGHPWATQFASPTAPEPGAPWLGFAEADLRMFGNTSFPVGSNDGVVWQGKGLTTALDLGASAGWRGLSLTLRPTLLFTQNAEFELASVAVPGMPIYAYPWRRMDMPQRFGPDSYWSIHPGDSELRIRGFGATAGVSTANLWWGPAQRNAIVMSNHAPGFPHAFVGTDGPIGIGIGELEVQWVWGDLEQTEWFDPAFAEKDRFLTGLVAVYSPSFLDGLSLGLARVFYAWDPEGGVPASDYFLVFQDVRKDRFRTAENPEGDDEHDQLLSLFGRWVIAPAGFEVYWEWSRNDHSRDLRDFALQPAHSRGYTLGLQHSRALSGDRLLALRAEITDLEKSRHPRATPTYYYHHVVRQGYTNDGQVIGAWVGPGGNAQHLAGDLYTRWGGLGVFVERSVRDNDAFQEWTVDKATEYWEHDVSLSFGAHARRFLRDFEVGGGAILTRQLNRYFEGRDLWNLNLSFQARWRPR